MKSLSRVRLFVAPRTAAYQVPLPMGFSRQEDWSGCHCVLWRWEVGWSQMQDCGKQIRKLSPSLRGGGWGGFGSIRDTRSLLSRQRRGSCPCPPLCTLGWLPRVPKARHGSHICLWACLGCLCPLDLYLIVRWHRQLWQVPVAIQIPLGIFTVIQSYLWLHLVSKLGTRSAKAPLSFDDISTHCCNRASECRARITSLPSLAPGATLSLTGSYSVGGFWGPVVKPASLCKSTGQLFFPPRSSHPLFSPTLLQPLLPEAELPLGPTEGNFRLTSHFSSDST